MKILCVGRNYSEHIKELHNQANETPVIFMKPDSALLQRRLPFFIPEFSNEIHHELELVIKIKKNGKNIAERFAHKYFDAITVGIDFTARDLQQQLKAKGLPWELSKGFDGSGPVGEFIPVNELESLRNIDFHLDINGELRQKGNSGDMIFSFAQIISYISEFITLKNGDLIFTGTPSGVGKVKTGDKLAAFIGEKKLLTVNVK
ncbi:MAG TPA: fumarylacetoacetate hydrolase family protein [Bacteroidia bacterium]|nr:fumarylacetoacetate hydrolase family protein [Bacteroidia bacterium]